MTSRQETNSAAGAERPPERDAGRARPVILALALALGAPAAAQTAPDDSIALPPIDVNAAPAGRLPAASPYLAPSTSSATRTDTPLRDIPQSVTVTTRQTIRDLSMQNLQDVLRWVPGASYAQGEGNRDTPVLRGQATTASLFQDGLRDDVQYVRDLYNLERVEVLLGPNAMIFGRGGGGGVINRVTRMPDWETVREVRLQAGSFNTVRGSFDVGQGVTDRFAFRLLGMYEQGDSFRSGVNFRRSGINPGVALRLGENTTIRISYENFRDERVADRGIPSFNGRPLTTGVSTFFGDPGRSPVHVNVNALNVFAEHRFDSGIVLRNAFRFADHDKAYQNVFTTGVNAAGTAANFAAYNNATQRTNLINQTDLLLNIRTGPFEHRVLAGVELGRQETSNIRQTGYFTAIGPNATSFSASLAAPRINTPIVFRPSATDANNAGVATNAALYVQDQVQLLPSLQLVAGLRFEHFHVDFTNNRTGDRFRVEDNTVSPRVGLIWRPLEPLTFYASFANSYLPRAGEQLASLTLANQNLRPESFTNYEIGARYDVAPGLAVTAALYQLDRTNVAVADPANPTRSILVDGTRNRGFELGVRGDVTDRWSVLGGWAVQEGEVTSRQSATVARGNGVPFLPRNAVTLWNRYQVLPRLGLGLGLVHQSSYFASTDNRVRIPGYTRLDAAAFWSITDRWGLQANVENLTGTKYYPVADNNNNISPGAPITARFALTARF